MENKTGIKKIAVLTSGGDAPGMNAAVRAIVRAGISSGLEVYGVRRGYHGLIKGEISKLERKDVSEKLNRGGTFLLTARSESFRTPEGRKKAADVLRIYGIDALCVLGGDGSYAGAQKLSNEQGVQVIGIPCTIDNDIACTDYTIGFDTAMNTALDAIDKIRDTSSSHERCSVIEVMGRHAGHIALSVGIASGAEVILIPEVPYDLNDDVLKVVMDGRNVGKHHYLVVMAEGVGSAEDLAKTIEKETGIETRATILGHVQRGGTPTLRDRVRASLMGIKAVECALTTNENLLICEKGGEMATVPINEGLAMKKTISPEIIEDAKLLF